MSLRSAKPWVGHVSSPHTNPLLLKIWQFCKVEMVKEAAAMGNWVNEELKVAFSSVRVSSDLENTSSR